MKKFIFTVSVEVPDEKFNEFIESVPMSVEDFGESISEEIEDLLINDNDVLTRVKSNCLTIQEDLPEDE